MGKKVLVIDDDMGILESLRLVLEDAGYKVDTAEDGRVLDAFGDGRKPDLILLDYWLPRVNGGELTRNLKGNKNTHGIPVVIISASLNVRDTVRRAGADDFLPKPYDIDDLLRIVEKHISNRPAG